MIVQAGIYTYCHLHTTQGFILFQIQRTLTEDTVRVIVTCLWLAA